MPSIYDAPWRVLHEGHLAWYQRAALVGDFAPGRPPRPEYVIYSDDRCADPGGEPPVCEGCGQVPKTDDLLLVERLTGACDFLEPFRRGRFPWPPGTDPKTCAWCNVAGLKLRPGYVRLCDGCAETLASGG